MKLEYNIKKIKDFILDRYKGNLAAILIFGSANTGPFNDRDSDIDHMIFLKRLNVLNPEKELKSLYDRLKKYNFASQYFNDLKGFKNYMGEGKHFSSYITITSNDGAKIVYTTPEFRKTKTYLRKHPPTKKDIKENILEKDKFELNGYFNNLDNFNLTKALTSHIRRKLQVINYFKTGELIFDYGKCLDHLNFSEMEKDMLDKLYMRYEKRGKLSDKEIDYYKDLSRRFTEKIIQS